MASSFPGSLDSFTNPTGANDLGDSVGGRTHSAMHADINDAVENIQAALGANLAKMNSQCEVLSSTSFCHPPRFNPSATLANQSQRLWLQTFVCPISFTPTNLSVYVTSPGTASTTSILGIYTIDGAGAGTLMQQTTNDTALFSSTGLRTKAITTPVALVAGTRYAFAVLQNGGSQATLQACSGMINLALTPDPWWCGYRDSQTSFASFAKANLTANFQPQWFMVS